MKYVKLILSIFMILGLNFHLYANEEKKLYPSGSVHFIYNKSDEKLDGVSKEFYENGNIKTEFTYEKGKLISEKRYRNDAQIEYEFYLKYTKKHETLRIFHSSGALFRERLLIDGAQEGVERDYYPNGKLKAERNYKKGKKEGVAKGYYKNGRVQGDWLFKNGVPVSATIFFMTGEMHLVHEFKDGKIHGVTKEYDKKGHLKAERHYQNDKLIKRVRK